MALSRCSTFRRVGSIKAFVGRIALPVAQYGTTIRMSSSSSSSSSTTAEKGDSWSPKEYLEFTDQRGRPIKDLINFLYDNGVASPKRIVDLGCGPGNSTEALCEAFPTAQISGMDSSKEMLEQARQKNPGVDFVEDDIQMYAPDPETDLLFSNAVFHWLRRHLRIEAIQRLVCGLKKGGVFAMQVPDNYHAASHVAMRDVAYSHPAFAPYFRRFLKSGMESSLFKPELDRIESSWKYYNQLIPYCERVELWHTSYRHVLNGHADIVRWVRSTGLRPFLELLPKTGGVREDFENHYQRQLELKYPRLADGKVMLTYPRMFLVAFRGDKDIPLPQIQKSQERLARYVDMRGFQRMISSARKRLEFGQKGGPDPE
ncbi:S-adenosyl-L-methionine-dependent methyltransferase [Podospora australis]|uniref:S-adenosyl-L-methionine-dependent methyltransferase n=1 Tax=Podospora australis TaxID=1536484 RepID=A0AAN6WM63_9PEZI|nr:S-adenosyl-L-methionine-dependent methyltransferase [Podospora australis]